MPYFRWTLLLAVWSWCPLSGFAQENALPQSSVEELRVELAGTREPTTRAKLELRLAYSADLGTAERHAAALGALDTLGPNGDMGLRSLAWSAVCWTHGRLGKPEAARVACDDAVELARAADDLSRLHTAVTARAALAFERGDMDSAMLDFTEASRLAEELDNSHNVASALNNLGSMARMKGGFYQAVSYYERALAAAVLTNSDYLEASTANNLGIVSLELHMPEEALERFRQTLRVAQRGGLENLQFVGKRGIAAARLALGESEAAATELRTLVRDDANQAEPMQLAAAYDALAKAELAVGSPAAALAASRQAVSRYREAGAQRRRLKALSGLAVALAATADTPGALAAIDEVIADNADMHLKHMALQTKADILSSIQKHAEAYATLREADQLRDQLDGEQAREQLAVMRSSLESERREQELATLRARQASLEARAQLERWIGVGVLVVTAVLLISGFLLRRSTVRHRTAEQESALAANLHEQDAVLQAELERQVELRSRELEREIRERRQLEGQLEHNRKLEALGKLTGGIAHDFNNLMTVVLGSMDLLRAEQGEPIGATQLELVEGAAKAAQSGAAITESLLAFARAQNLQPSELRLVDFFANIKGLIRRTVGEGITLELECDIPELGVFVDADQLTTALINLAANARDSMGGRGAISIRGSNRSVTEAEPAGAEPARYTAITVTDAGKGMTAEELERACEPFFSTKEAGAGTGLGLSMVFGFAKQSGGDLQITSTPGVGTTATLLLPQFDYQLSTPAKPDAATPRSFEGMRALIVEDRPDVRKLMQSMLARLGFSVEVSEDAEAARRWFLSGQGADFVFSDVVMPGGMNGIELAQWLEAHYPEVRVLLTSGFPDSYAATNPRARLLRKPFRLEQLREAIHASLDRS